MSFLCRLVDRQLKAEIKSTFLTFLLLTNSLSYLESLLLSRLSRRHQDSRLLNCFQFSIKINNFQCNHFNLLVTPKQIERLYSRFTSLDRSDCGTLSREDFLRIPELAINPLCDRIVHSFIADSNDDRVNFRQFMQVLARFRTIKKGKENKLNNREEKLRCEF